MKRTIYVAAVIAGLAGGAYAGTAADQLGLNKTPAGRIAVEAVSPVPAPVMVKTSLAPQNHLTVPLVQAEITSLAGIFNRVGVVATVENADCTSVRAVIDTRHRGFNPNKWSIAYGNTRAALTSEEIPAQVSLFDRLNVAPVANGIETVYQVTVKERVCNNRPAVWTATYDVKSIAQKLAGSWVFSQTDGSSKGCELKLVTDASGNRVELGSCQEQFEFLGKVTGWKAVGTSQLQFLGAKNSAQMTFKLDAAKDVWNDSTGGYYIERQGE